MIQIIQKVVGVWLILVNLYWVYHNLQLIYRYQSDEIYFYLQLPYWLVILNVIGSLFGSVIGVRVFREMIPELKGIGMNFLIGVCLFLIDILYHAV